MLLARRQLREWLADRASAGFASLLVWLCVFVMVVPQGLEYGSLGNLPTSSDPLSKAIWLFLLIGSAGQLLLRWPKLLTLLRWMNPYLLLLLLLAAASVLWSFDPTVTLRRTVRAGTVIAVCLSFVLAGWTPHRFQQLLRSILTAVMVLSIAFVMLDPQNAIHASDQVELKDAWHGITVGKNLLGSLASIAVLLWLHAWLTRQSRMIPCIAGLLVSGLCLAQSRSAASLLATAFAVVLMLFLMRAPTALKRAMPYMVGLFAATVLLYSIAILHLINGLDFLLKPIMVITGKELTFTGRTDIWAILREQIALHPWLGGGYGAYWVSPSPGSPSFEMLLRLGFYPAQGHNGYLDVINDLGIVGGMLLMLYFASYLTQSLKLVNVDRPQAALYLALLFRGFLADMSESHWFYSMATEFVILTLATFSVGRHLLHNELIRRAAGRIPVRGW